MEDHDLVVDEPIGDLPEVAGTINTVRLERPIVTPTNLDEVAVRVLDVVIADAMPA